MKSKFRAKDGAWLGGETAILYSGLKFSVDYNQYNYLSSFYQSLKTCFARPVPERTADSVLPPATPSPTQSPSIKKEKKEKEPALPPPEEYE
jgi:hypothetical protein